MKIIDTHAHVAQCIAGTGSQGELRPASGGRAVYATGQSLQILPHPTARSCVSDAVNIVRADRLLWGSDMPSLMTRDTHQHFIDFIALHPDLNSRDKEKILYANAAKLFFSL